jgi:hypothetical protein
MFRKLLNLFRPNRLDADLREELEFHRLQTSGSSKIASVAALAAIVDAVRNLLWLR